MRTICPVVRCVFYSVRLALKIEQTIFDVLNITK